MWVSGRGVDGAGQDGVKIQKLMLETAEYLNLAHSVKSLPHVILFPCLGPHDYIQAQNTPLRLHVFM